MANEWIELYDADATSSVTIRATAVTRVSTSTDGTLVWLGDSRVRVGETYQDVLTLLSASPASRAERRATGAAGLNPGIGHRRR